MRHILRSKAPLPASQAYLRHGARPGAGSEAYVAAEDIPASEHPGTFSYPTTGRDRRSVGTYQGLTGTPVSPAVICERGASASHMTWACDRQSFRVPRSHRGTAKAPQHGWPVSEQLLAALCLVRTPSTLCAAVHTRFSTASQLLLHYRLQVRPYTVRRGDTLESIAQKRELDVLEVQKLNHNVSPGQSCPSLDQALGHHLRNILHRAICRVAFL